ncbi:MAG: type 1 pili tip component [Woeseiaceae bacterium]|nr:type 1 pili tip component [Woeseiaceae bacterium]
MNFKALLDTWSASEPPPKTRKTYEIHLTVEDAARIAALSDLFPGMSVERIIGDLLSASLKQLQAEMPYEPGDRIIREDDFGDPVFEDAGLTPKFQELVKARLKSS